MLKIKQEFKQLIPPLLKEEYSELEKSILNEGVRDNILTWNEYIIDGHNRYEIASKHNIQFQVEKMKFENENEVKIWMINNQFGRRNLSNYQKSVLALELESVFKEKAKENLSKAGSSYSPKEPLQKSANLPIEKVDTRKEVAKVANVSHDTIAKVKKIQEKATPEVKEKLSIGEISINQAFKEIKKEEKKQERIEVIQQQMQDIETGKLPELKGLFEVISVDPPWAYEEKGGFSFKQHDPESNRGGVDYPTMTINQIKEINLPLADNGIVFLWTTHSFLRDAFDILQHWGLDYKATLVWDKVKMGMGRTIRLQCEFCLIGFKGKPYYNGSAERDIITEARREHSRKPDAFFEFVERFTLGRKLEYFSREKRNGWEIYGNDTEKF